MSTNDNKVVFDPTGGYTIPHEPEIEEVVLGTVLLEPQTCSIYANELVDDLFYDKKFRTIAQSIRELSSKGDAVDIMTVTNHLKGRGELENAGGPYQVTTLTNRVASAANFEYHLMILKQYMMRRQIIDLGLKAQARGLNESEDILDTMSDVAKVIGDIMMVTATGAKRQTTEYIREIITDIDRAKKSKEVTGVRLPLKKPNERMGGWQNSDFIIIAARPAMGKSALAIQCATFPVYHQDKNVLFFSLEMSGKQVVSRILSQELEIKANRFSYDAKYMDENKLHTQLTKNSQVYENDIIIDDTPGLTIDQLVATVKKTNIDLIKKDGEGLHLVVIDYLQLITDPNISSKRSTNREQEISSISRKLKILAKDLDIPVIALSQLSRGVEARGGDRKPRLSDLRESGAIEQDADIIMFLNRPEYYGITQDEEGRSTEGIATLTTAKFRNGTVGDDIIRFKSEYVKFYDDYVEGEFEQFNQITPNDGFEDDKDNDDDQPF